MAPGIAKLRKQIAEKDKLLEGLKGDVFGQDYALEQTADDPREQAKD